MARRIRSRPMLALAVFEALLLTAAPAGNRALAYNEDGHFYTTIAIEHDRQPPFEQASRDDAIVIGFCSQMPDLANQLDAITLRANVIASVTGSLWGAFSACWSEGVRHMVTVHQYLHSFVDNSHLPRAACPADAVTEAAIATIEDLRNQELQNPDPNTACAIGFAIHLLGDSFAHRTLANRCELYPPGSGHFDDGHDPDYIDFTNDRMEQWVDYTHRLAKALGVDFDRSRWDDLRKVAVANLGGNEDNRFNTDVIISGLDATLSDNGVSQQQVWAAYYPPLEFLTARDWVFRQYVVWRDFATVVQTEMPKQNSPLRDAFQQLTYEKVWGTYKCTVFKEFKAHGITATCSDDSVTVICTPGQ